jgi:hypothetical protein
LVSIHGSAEANTAPAPMKNTCSANAEVRCGSGKVSATNARNGSIAMLIDAVSTHSIRQADQSVVTLGIASSASAVSRAPARM